MGCKEVIENNTYTTELIREIQRQTVRYFIAIIVSLMCNVFFVGYIFYDRYMDSQVYVEATEAITVSQDSAGCNNFINGNGDVNYGTDSKKTTTIKSKGARGLVKKK